MSFLKVPVSVSDHIQQGTHPLVTLLEYGDYECPYCGDAYYVVKQLQRKYSDTLSFVFRNFPLSEAHPHALNAAITAEFAGSRGLFWQAHDAFYEKQAQLGLPLFSAIISSLALPDAELQRAFEQSTYQDKIRADFKGGVRSGVNGTPCFFLDGRRYDGPAELTAMSAAVDQLVEAHNQKLH
jgi:protein-disulfide isomerase